jgi:carboxyl-terminal processing protease
MLDLNQRMMFKNADKFKPLGALRLTIQKFYRISGDSTQYRGVTPDIQLPDKFKGIKSGEQYLEYALPWDSVGPAQYPKWSDLGSDISILKEKSRQRVMSKQDFVIIEAESRRIIEQQKKTLLSLNINDVRKERAEARGNKGKDGKNPHDQTSQEKKAPGTQMTEKEKKELWIREVNDDVYIQEAVSVLSDILSLHPVISLN